jgi:hypothetical protein
MLNLEFEFLGTVGEFLNMLEEKAQQTQQPQAQQPQEPSSSESRKLVNLNLLPVDTLVLTDLPGLSSVRYFAQGWPTSSNAKVFADGTTSRHPYQEVVDTVVLKILPSDWKPFSAGTNIPPGVEVDIQDRTGEKFLQIYSQDTSWENIIAYRFTGRLDPEYTL